MFFEILDWKILYKKIILFCIFKFFFYQIQLLFDQVFCLILIDFKHFNILIIFEGIIIARSELL